MRSLVYLVAGSIDGRIADSTGSFAAFPGAEDVTRDFLDRIGGFDDVLFGRRTYEVALRDGITDPYPRLRSHLFSRSLVGSPHPNVRLVRDGAESHVAALKRQPGRDIWLCGGADLAGCLIRAGLVDRLMVKLNPLLLGDGLPLAAGLAAPATLRLADVKRFDSGTLLLTYDLTAPGG